MARIINALAGIDGLDGLGEIVPYARKAILENQTVVSKVLQQTAYFSGLGFVEGKRVPFE